MAKLQTGTRIFGTANVDSTLVVGNISPTNSTSNSTGSLIVTGGVGISGNLWSDKVFISNTTTSTSNTTGSLIVTGGVGLTGNLYMKGSANITAQAVLTDDMLSIDTAGYPVTTAGLNAINVRYQGGAAAIEGTAVRVDAIPGSTAGGIWNSYRILQSTGAASGVVANGVKFDNITSAGGTDNMIYAGTGWDSIINLNGTSLIHGSGAIKLINGTTAEAPIYANANGALLTTATQGAIEVAANNIYYTSNPSIGTGRNVVQASQFGVLATSATVASGGAFFTNTVRPQLAQGQYHHFRYYLAWTKATAGTLTYSFTPTAGTFVNLRAEARTYVAGAVLAAVTNMASITATASATTTSSASASIANNAAGYTIIEGFVVPSTNCRLSLLVTDSAGTVTSVLGSNFLVTNLGAVNIGNIA